MLVSGRVIIKIPSFSRCFFSSCRNWSWKKPPTWNNDTPLSSGYILRGERSAPSGHAHHFACLELHIPPNGLQIKGAIWAKRYQEPSGATKAIQEMVQKLYSIHPPLEKKKQTNMVFTYRYGNPYGKKRRFSELCKNNNFSTLHVSFREV